MLATARNRAVCGAVRASRAKVLTSPSLRVRLQAAGMRKETPELGSWKRRAAGVVGSGMGAGAFKRGSGRGGGAGVIFKVCDWAAGDDRAARMASVTQVWLQMSLMLPFCVH